MGIDARDVSAFSTGHCEWPIRQLVKSNRGCSACSLRDCDGVRPLLCITRQATGKFTRLNCGELQVRTVVSQTMDPAMTTAIDTESKHKPILGGRRTLVSVPYGNCGVLRNPLPRKKTAVLHRR
jgi:hypothetical protein